MKTEWAFMIYGRCVQLFLHDPWSAKTVFQCHETFREIKINLILVFARKNCDIDCLGSRLINLESCMIFSAAPKHNSCRCRHNSSAYFSMVIQDARTVNPALMSSYCTCMLYTYELWCLPCRTGLRVCSVFCSWQPCA